MAANININGETKDGYLLYSGNPLDNHPNPIAYLIHDHDGGYSTISYIGDVNKDGLGDFVCVNRSGRFSIYLGLDWRTVGVASDIADNAFAIRQNIPNPVGKDRKTLLPTTLKKAGKYTIHLCDMRGAMTKTLFDDVLPEGENTLPLDLTGLPNGMYILKMSNGSVHRERAIIIGE